MQHIDYQDILKGLKNLPIKENPVILVHSSLKSFGFVEGGARTVIDALLKICGDKGTLVMPTLTFNSVDENAPFFDVMETPSECGIITEVFRRLPQARRSLHVVSSAAALGEKAEYITRSHDNTPCGPETPYGKVIELEGYSLFIGTTFRSNTLFHAAEEYISPSYMRYKTLKNAKIKDYDGSVRACSCKRYDCWQTGIIRKLEKMRDIFEQEHVLSGVTIGNSEIILIKATDNFRISCDVLKNNPGFILG